MTSPAIFIQLNTIIHFITYAIDFGHVCLLKAVHIFNHIYINIFLLYDKKRNYIYDLYFRIII